ncbi:hypothetical protein ACVWXO_009562 [Bradyrhizobium sp. LM2.7]
MTLIDQMKAEPWRFDFFHTLREFERANPDRPRIGDSAARRDEYVDLGQVPYLEFPASNLAAVEDHAGRLRILVKFLGLLGPQGALPIATTDESLGWWLMRDDAFPRFLDLLNGRFLQLFFRAWADARPIAQHDRPAEDRFIAYVGSFTGLGSAVFADRDTVPDMAKLSFAGLVAPKAKCASRLMRSSCKDYSTSKSRSTNSSAPGSHSTQVTAAGSAERTQGSVRTRFSARACSASRTRSGFGCLSEILLSTNNSCRPRRPTCRNHWPTLFSSISATNWNGRSSSPFLRERSYRSDSDKVVDLDGPPGYRRTGPPRKYIAAMPAFSSVSD